MANGFLDRSRIVAPSDWSRWLIPPAALSVHLAIGQAYAWSVFKAPLEKALTITGSQSALPFQLGIVMLGLSAAVFGTRVERNGPRWAMFCSLVCFCSGFLISALGMMTKQYWLVVLGYGGVGGIGLGIGYISPVSTLIKWFPDRPGMATGIAIMGFGGGALIASPWSAEMLRAFGVSYDAAGKVLSVADGAIATTFLVHGLVDIPPGVLTRSVLEVSREDFSHVMSVVSWSLIAACRHARPLLLRSTAPRVVALTSACSHRMTPHYHIAGIAKAALESAVLYLAMQLGRDGVLVNAVSAGLLATDGAIRAIGEANAQATRAVQAKRSATGRAIDPEDVASCVSYLCSPLARNVTGEIVTVDGGFSRAYL